MDSNIIFFAQAVAEEIAAVGIPSAPEVSFWDHWAVWLVLRVIFGVAALAVIMCFAAVGVVLERKVCGFIQGRYGPMETNVPYIMLIPVVGKILQRLGLQQLIADALKFLLKEEPLPNHVDKFWYNAAPVMSLAPVLISACFIPFGYFVLDGERIPLSPTDVDFSLLLVLILGSLGVYGAVMAGWASNNKYSYLGGVRATAQMISYELTMLLAIVPMLMWIAPYIDNPFSLFEIGLYQGGFWNCFAFPLSAFLFLIALFAETNRQPFDMAESEADLVGGFHTDYGAFKFGLFFVGEYGHMALGSALFVTLFLGAWSPLPGLVWPESWGWIATVLGFVTFLVKIFAMMFLFVWVRWTLPRFRYDHVMNLGWSKLLPLAVLNLIFYMVLARFV